MRRFHKIQGKVQAVCITTSNMKECQQTDYVVNFASYASASPEIIDNSGFMVLRLLIAVAVKKFRLQEWTVIRRIKTMTTMIRTWNMIFLRKQNNAIC